jgi:D-alanyl-lipoteichoic acid acyltransferase DltB (MBOAT superfamily)
LLLLASVAFNYLIGLLLMTQRLRALPRRVVLAAGVSCDLLVLGTFKYAGFLAANLDALFSTGLTVNLLLPVGISFYTFTQIAFLVDAYRGKVAHYALPHYALFVTYFPHLIAGPILHHKDMIPQFEAASSKRPNPHLILCGLIIFGVGLFKKTALADGIQPLVSLAFGPVTPSFDQAWIGALAYTFQLYFDFSGYSDMAVGLARMFNLRFPLNFNSPYKAASVIDYWQRWHMTLTRYLMGYLYNPIALGIARRRIARGLSISRAVYATPGGFASLVLVPIFITMAIAGVWHGAGAQFLVFGLLHAVYLSVNHAWRILGPRRAHGVAPGFGAHLGSVALTYLCVLVGSVFFRALSVPDALSMLEGMMGLHGLGPGFPVPDWLVTHAGVPGTILQAHGVIELARWQETVRALVAIGGLVGLYIIVWLLPNTQQIFIRMAPVLDTVEPGPIAWLRWRGTLPWAIAFGCASALGLISIGGTGEFLYFQF